MNDIILSFDVGIVHLAYCLFTKENGNWKILEWGNIDLTNRILSNISDVLKIDAFMFHGLITERLQLSCCRDF